MDEKKALEKRLFIDFLKSYDHNIGDSIEFSESPDIIYQLEGSKVGVEITEYFHDQNEKHSALKATESVSQKFGNQIITKLNEEKLTDFFHFEIDFSNEFKFSAKNLDRNVSIVIQKIKSYLEYFDLKNGIRIDDLELMKSGINRIYLTSSINNNYFFGNFQGGSIGDIQNHQIEQIIDKKNGFLERNKYQSCDEYWLIIRIGNYYAGSYDNIIAFNPSKKGFKKVFLFDYAESKLIEV